MRRPWIHVEPKARSGVELFAISDELKSAFHDLDDGHSRCLMLAQSLSFIEAEDCDLCAVIVEDHT